MRKLTTSVDQVLGALKGSEVVEFSDDNKMIRKKLK